MFLIIGIRFFTWGSQRAMESTRCGACGTIAQFTIKKGMRFITLFFIIPVIPISGVTELLECPVCKTRYRSAR